MYKDVYNLSPDQLDELRNNIFCGCHETGNLDFDEMEIVNAAACYTDIPDEIVFCCYSGYTFTNDDFFCTAGK